MSHRKRESLPLRNARYGRKVCASVRACVRACVRVRGEKVAWPGQTLTLRTARARVRPNRFGARSRRSPDSRTDRQAILSSRRRFEPRGSEESGTEAQPLVCV